MKRSGFTLIELLISTALISAVFIALFYFYSSSLQLMNRSMGVSRSLQIVRFITGRMTADIAQSSGISSGSGKTKLLIGPISYEFTDGKLRRSEGSDTYYMTDDGELKSMEFYYEQSKLVKIAVMPKYGGSYYFTVHARN